MKRHAAAPSFREARRGSVRMSRDELMFFVSFFSARANLPGQWLQCPSQWPQRLLNLHSRQRRLSLHTRHGRSLSPGTFKARFWWTWQARQTPTPPLTPASPVTLSVYLKCTYIPAASNTGAPRSQGGALSQDLSMVQGYLAHKKEHPPRTLQ